jgi:formylglycine-generating enzyme required for sulfatase activity
MKKNIFPSIPSLLCLFILLASGCGPAPVSPTSTAIPPAETPSPTQLPTEPPLPTAEFTPTETSSPTPGTGSSMTAPVDGMRLVFVPEGAFLMGYAGGFSDELPEHNVTLNAFWIDQTEITNGAYELCVQAGTCKPPSRFTSNAIDHYYGNPDYTDYPVIYVSWNDAQTYCNWAGMRLPTEAEWEKAARGTDGRIYPWGDSAPDDHLANFDDHVMDVTLTGSYPEGASPYGALDMAGNVWEWTSDWYGKDYYSQSPSLNPGGPETGTKRVIRGGSWIYDAPGSRTSYRFSKDPAYASYDTGFRCVLPSP